MLTILMALVLSLANAQGIAGSGYANAVPVGSLGFPSMSLEETLRYSEEQANLAKEKDAEADRHLAEANKLEGCMSCESSRQESLRLYNEASSDAYQHRNNSEGIVQQYTKDNR